MRKGLIGEERKDSEERTARKGLLRKEGKDGKVRTARLGKRRKESWERNKDTEERESGERTNFHIRS